MQEIYTFLRSNEARGEIIKGVKVLDKHSSRANQLIERLKAFVPEETTYESLLEPQFVNQSNKEWYMFRNLAIIAINEYIKEFPFLMHTPSSLRSIFGMPTRKDRKRGKYSGKELIDKAFKEVGSDEDFTNYESVEELADQLQEISESHPEHRHLCNDLIEYLNNNLNRNSQLETYVPEISTHSFESLEFVKEFLKKLGITNVIHERDEEYPYKGENKLLTPDLLGSFWNEQIWFELKEWESFNNFFSPIKQLLNYLEANIPDNNHKANSYVGIVVTNKVMFFQFLEKYLNEELTFNELRMAITPKLNEIKHRLDNIHLARNKYLNIGRLMVRKNLQIKTEALYIGLFSEFINKELGMLNSEYESGVQILTTINTLETRANSILIRPLNNIQEQDKPRNNLILFLGVLNSQEKEKRADNNS